MSTPRIGVLRPNRRLENGLAEHLMSTVTDSFRISEEDFSTEKGKSRRTGAY
jgi:hypothetical protein